MGEKEVKNNILLIPKLKCEISKIKKSLDDIIESNNDISSIDSIIMDNSGKLIITYTNKSGVNTVETDTLKKFILKYNVLNYTELLTKNPDLYDYAYVREEQGTKWLSGFSGGNYYGPGLYMWNGEKWTTNTTDIYNQLHQVLNTLSAIDTNNYWESAQW
jgi:hypothetical protein